MGPVLVMALVYHGARVSMPYSPLVACRTASATLVARAGSIGVLVPIAVGAVVLMATGLSIAHQLWVTHRVMRRVMRGRRPPTRRLRRISTAVGLDNRLDLVSDGSVYTFCHGYLRPRVALSTGMAALLDDAELTAVLEHEAHHVRHYDPLKILASRAMASGLFMLPVAGALRDGYLSGKELAADADAGRRDDGSALASALVKLLRAERPQWPAGVMAVGAISATERRIEGLLVPGTTSIVLPAASQWIVSLALLAGLFGFSFGASAAATSEPVAAACATGLQVVQEARPEPACASPMHECILRSVSEK
jgi:Zn-dependent protease with chaperone function